MTVADCGLSVRGAPQTQIEERTAKPARGNMSALYDLCKSLQHSSIGTAIRDSAWLFPIIETVHIFGIISLVGSTSILDLRLMGFTFRDEPVSRLAVRFLPWTWGGF